MTTNRRRLRLRRALGGADPGAGRAVDLGFRGQAGRRGRPGSCRLSTISEIRAPISVFTPISSASPSGADIPGGVPVRLVLTHSGSHRSKASGAGLAGVCAKSRKVGPEYSLEWTRRSLSLPASGAKVRPVFRRDASKSPSLREKLSRRRLGIETVRLG